MPDSSSLRQDLARTALGDRAAFERVYSATSAHLFGVALRILRRNDLAEEVLQEAFVNVWHHADSYDAAASQPMTWLISVVRNKAFDHLRSHARHEAERLDAALEEDLPDEREGPLQMLTRATDAMRIRGCLETLQPSYRQSLALAFYHGLSHAEIARQLHAPLGSVKSWVRRGLERIKQCLGGVA